MCQVFLLLVAGVLTFFGIRLLRENNETDNPEKKVNVAIPVVMLAVAGFLALVVIRTFFVPLPE